LQRKLPMLSPSGSNDQGAPGKHIAVNKHPAPDKRKAPRRDPWGFL
jgi:hypothetical protein